MINKIYIMFFILLLCSAVKANELNNNIKILKLCECIDISVQNNPSIAMAEAELKIASAKTDEVKSDKYPKIKVGGGLSNYSYQSGWLDVKQENGSTNLSKLYLERNHLDAEMGIDIEQILYDGGRIDSQVILSKIEEENARIKLQETKETIIYNVKLAFYSGLKLKEKMSLARENAKAVEEHLKLSKKLFEIGIVPEVDAVTAEVALSKAKMLLNQSQNEYEKSLGKLKLAMGIDINQIIDIEENNDYIPVNIDENTAMKKAVENRSENKMLNSSQNLQNSINPKENAFAPTISAHTGYIVRNDDSMGRKNFYVELGISFPIFNIPGYKAKEERVKAVIEQIEKQKELLEQKIKLDVKNSIIDVKSACENVNVSLQEIEVASKGLKISEGKYKAGVGTIMELTEAQLNLLKAKTDYLDSLYNYKIAIATVEHMVGVNIKDIEKSKE